MALSFKEKRGLTGTVREKIALIQGGGLGFKEKREATKAMTEAVKRLGEDVAGKQGETGNVAETVNSGSLLAQLQAGIFNQLPPLDFISKLREVEAETKDITPLKPPAIVFVEQWLSQQSQAAA